MISRVSVRTTLVVVMALGVVIFAPPAVAGDAPAFTLDWKTNDGSVSYDWDHFGTLYGLGMHQVTGNNQDWLGWRYEGNVIEPGWELKWRWWVGSVTTMPDGCWSRRSRRTGWTSL